MIRKYEQKDLPEMIAVWNEVVEDGVAFPQEETLTMETGMDFFALQTYTAVAEVAGRVVGLYILHPNNVGRCGHICNASYAVASSCRGLHIGEKLVLDCLEQAAKHGFRVLQFNAVVESNASGSDGLEGSTLNVTFGEGADYSGAIASTSAIHVTYDGSVAVKEAGGYAFDDADKAADFAEQYQNTSFTIEEYWSIGQVANLVNDNGANTVNVTLTGNAVWNVTGTSLIASLSIEGDAQVVIPEDITLTVNGTEYTDCVLTAKDM